MPANVAVPLAAVCCTLPDNVAEPGFAPIASVTFVALSVVTTLLFASRTCTDTDGEIATPATAFAGCTLKARCVAVPGVMLKVELVAPASGWMPPVPVVSVATSL